MGKKKMFQTKYDNEEGSSGRKKDDIRGKHETTKGIKNMRKDKCVGKSK